jgi:hypothetical protein
VEGVAGTIGDGTTGSTAEAGGEANSSEAGWGFFCFGKLLCSSIFLKSHHSRSEPPSQHNPNLWSHLCRWKIVAKMTRRPGFPFAVRPPTAIRTQFGRWPPATRWSVSTTSWWAIRWRRPSSSGLTGTSQNVCKFI